MAAHFSAGGSAGSGNGAAAGVFGDTTLTKVFVGGLAWETQRETMSRYFEQFGEIVEAVVITDKNTGRSKGYGFVTFRDPESARMACADPTPVIDGRRTNCNLASLGARSRPSPSPLAAAVSAAAGGYVATTPPAFSQPAAAAQYAYQQAGLYSYVPAQYGFPAYSVDYPYQQSLYSPSYGGAQYAAVYPGQPHAAGAVAAAAGANPAVYTYSAYGQPLPYSPPPAAAAAAYTYSPPSQTAFAVQTPTHLMQFSPGTIQSTMPPYAGSVPIHAAAATPNSGYSIQANSTSSQVQASLQAQFSSISTQLVPQQAALGGGNSEKQTS